MRIVVDRIAPQHPQFGVLALSHLDYLYTDCIGKPVIHRVAIRE